jgi:hypothetical protein
MRPVLVAASLLVVLVACSSEEDDCPIVGTYAVLGAAEAGNTCPDPASSTISADGPNYTVAIQGLQGLCAAQPAGTCKVQGKCDVLVKDATDPVNNMGTFQFAWTFDSGGFKGSATVAIPDSVSLPGGCSGSVAQTGQRR